MTYKNFYDFLMVKCIEDTHALDDMLPDVFESWICDADVEDIMEWGDEYGEQKRIEGAYKAYNDSIKVLNDIGGLK